MGAFNGVFGTDCRAPKHNGVEVLAVLLFLDRPLTQYAVCLAAAPCAAIEDFPMRAIN